MKANEEITDCCKREERKFSLHLACKRMQDGGECYTKEDLHRAMTQSTWPYE